MASTELFPTQDISERGAEWYEKLRPTIEPAHYGGYLAIEVETGDHAIAGSSGDAMRELYRRHPGASFYIRRVGEVLEPELAARLLRRELLLSRPRPAFDADVLRAYADANADEELALADSDSEHRSVFLVREDSA